MAIQRDAKGRFIKGVVTNPNGRPKKEHTLSDILRAKLEETIKTQRVSTDGKTVEEAKLQAEVLIEVWIKAAMEGDPKTIKDIVERLEGKPVQPTVDETPKDPLDQLGAAERKERIRELAKKLTEDKE